ncbi:lysine-rich arabinogalactan protein 19-like [Miscanthus floridulus]|uniref:lysine-rich arabinogalactan protein 19-like n=1 Tax=Miscanthus floridulus TaxID=154761 RepID=UPI00345A17E5
MTWQGARRLGAVDLGAELGAYLCPASLFLSLSRPGRAEPRFVAAAAVRSRASARRRLHQPPSPAPTALTRVTAHTTAAPPPHQRPRCNTAPAAAPPCVLACRARAPRPPSATAAPRGHPAPRRRRRAAAIAPPPAPRSPRQFLLPRRALSSPWPRPALPPSTAGLGRGRRASRARRARLAAWSPGHPAPAPRHRCRRPRHRRPRHLQRPAVPPPA